MKVINNTIISLAKSSDHFNLFNKVINILVEHDRAYKSPDINDILIEKLTLDSQIPNNIIKAIKENNLLNFKKVLNENNLANAKSNSDEYLIFLTAAAQYDSKEIVSYILEQGINPLNRKIVPYDKLMEGDYAFDHKRIIGVYLKGVN